MADDIRAALLASAKRIGADPLDLATVISYETGGTFSPSIRGGAGNRHIGLIQFGPTEQRQYGANQGQSFAEQLAAVENYLGDRGFKPGMNRLDLYSTINAGRPGRHNASDAGNGGAPGTVADKVAGQMGAHEAKAAAFLGGDFTPRMPTGQAPAGRFGLGGPVASDAETPAMTMPAVEPAEAPIDVARLLQLVGASAAPAPTAAQTSPPPRPRLDLAQAPAPAFDAERFWSLLRGR